MGLLWTDEERKFLAKVVTEAVRRGGEDAAKDFLDTLDRGLLLTIRDAVRGTEERHKLSEWVNKYAAS